MRRLISAFSGSIILVIGVQPALAQNYWQPAGALSPLNEPVTSIAVNANGYIFAGTSSLGSPDIVYRSTDNGVSWYPISNGLANGPVLGCNKKGDIFLGGGYQEFRSTDNGDHWTTIRITPANPQDPTIDNFSDSKLGQLYVSTGSTGLYVSTNNGDSWYEQGVFQDIYSFPTYVACNPTGTLFAATETAVDTAYGIGAYWYPMKGSFGSNSGLGASIVFGFSRDGEIMAGGTNGLFRSTDNGDDWTDITPPGANSSAVYSLAIGRNGNCFEALGDGSGISLSTDSGKDWTTINSGLTNTVVHAIAISPSGIAFIATDNGVFRSAASTGGVSEIPGKGHIGFELDQNYPNPFHSTTSIHFSLPQEAFVSIGVYDFAGRQVAVLANENHPAGSYDVSFDAAGLPNGVYTYQMDCAGFHQARMFVLLR